MYTARANGLVARVLCSKLTWIPYGPSYLIHHRNSDSTPESSAKINLTWFVNEFVNSPLFQSFGHWVRQFVTEFVNSSLSSSICHWVRQFVTEFVNSSMSSSIRQWVRQFVNEFVNSSLSSSIRQWVRQFVNEFVNTSSIHHWKLVNIDELNLVRQRVCDFDPYSIIWTMSLPIRHWVRQCITEFVNPSLSWSIRQWVRQFVNEFVNTSSIHHWKFVNIDELDLVRQRVCHFVPYSIIWTISSSIRQWVRQFVTAFVNSSKRVRQYFVNPSWKLVNIDELDLVRQRVCQFVPYSESFGHYSSLSSSLTCHWVRRSSMSFSSRPSSSMLRRSATANIDELDHLRQ